MRPVSDKHSPLLQRCKGRVREAKDTPIHHVIAASPAFERREAARLLGVSHCNEAAVPPPT